MAKAMCHISPSPVDPVMGKGRFPLAAWLPAAFFIHIYMYIYVCIYIYIFCVLVYIYIYVFICVNIYIYIWMWVKIVYGTFRGVPDVWNEGAS